MAERAPRRGGACALRVWRLRFFERKAIMTEEQKVVYGAQGYLVVEGAFEPDELEPGEDGV